MDYEQLYSEMQIIEKDLKEKFAALQKSQKSLAKNSETGDLKSAAKDLLQMSNVLKDYSAAVASYTEIAEGFDATEYLQNGDFAKQLTETCVNLSVDIKGEYPVYEIFPYKVKIDSENQDLYVDRKKFSFLRPKYFVSMLKQSLDKLNKASFNAASFLEELARAYDLAIIEKSQTSKSAKPGMDLYLKDLYKYMVPMQRSRRDYDMQTYAFDLARLHNSDLEKTKNENFFQFGPSRVGEKTIRILDRNGNERLLTTICFFEKK